MDRRGKKLDRLLRVRTLQLGLVRADEMRAVAKVTSETALRDRIAQLAQDVAPNIAPAFATSLMAAAHFRERLHQSATTAEQRVSTAQAGLTHARATSREARRDQHAIEKLIDRARIDAVLKELRALEELPATAMRKRHDPC